MTRDIYLTTAQLAKFVHTSPRTLERWRTEGRGPRFCKCGHKVLYHIDDVTAHLEANKHSHTSQY
ncbi:helix-turn-helix domain protein [Rhodobiaceae bacterium]|nr:helix-turn-helix domain protein [Rhodobiaceae bacterium]